MPAFTPSSDSDHPGPRRDWTLTKLLSLSSDCPPDSRPLSLHFDWLFKSEWGTAGDGHGEGDEDEDGSTMMFGQADVWLGLPQRGILRTGLGHRERTMQTLGVVRAYVGFFLTSCPFPLACETRIRHTSDAAPGSEGGVFADTKYVGLFGPASFSWCPYRALRTLFDASLCGVEGHLGHQDAPHSGTDHLLQKIATVIQAPAWARGSIVSIACTASSSGDGASIPSKRAWARNATREKHREPYSLSEAIGPCVAGWSLESLVLFYVIFDS
ncbi:hypothetical protein B0H13DRAFT_2343405 [Mycena leptocephala]|nr:hypothetical protein B0H13DRAFT_2343405 [Mycena leptocephala]